MALASVSRRSVAAARLLRFGMGTSCPGTWINRTVSARSKLGGSTRKSSATHATAPVTAYPPSSPPASALLPPPCARVCPGAAAALAWGEGCALAATWHAAKSKFPSRSTAASSRHSSWRRAGDTPILSRHRLVSCHPAKSLRPSMATQPLWFVYA